MELWNCLEILRNKKQSWLFKKDNLDIRLIALNKILELGNASTILDLIPFLKDDSKTIQQATCNVIVQLFSTIKTKKDYYDTLRYSYVFEADIDFYVHTFSNEQLVTVLAIATFNGNGYVRERAVKELVATKNGKAIPFLVYRLADWVQSVREAALKEIKNFKKIEFVDALVDNLSIFEWLQKVERTDLSSIYIEVLHFIIVENKNYVITNFKTFTDRTRFIIAKQISEAENISQIDLKLLLSDSNFLIRNLASNHFDKLTQPDIDKLLMDKSASVRIKTLYKIKDNPTFLDIVYPFISDNSAAIREFARYSLKNKFADFAIIYNHNLLNEINIVGSLSGIAETNGKQFIDSIEPFLKNKKVNVRKTAFLALTKLDSDKTYNYALQNLASEHIGIRNLAVDFLSKHATPEVLQKAREIFINGCAELKKSMLKLFSKIGKWTTVADIMIGTIDGDENIRQLSMGYLQQWENKATSYFTEPKQSDLERANHIFKFAFEMHEEKQFFAKNPLTGIDFYLR